MLRHSVSRFALAAGLALAATATHADLTPNGIFTGNVGLSVDGTGSNALAGSSVDAQIPVGATILQAYLYAAGIPTGSCCSGPATLAQYNAAGITLGGSAVSGFSALVGATSPASNVVGWRTARADVTTLVQGLVAAAAPMTSAFSWVVREGALNTVIDGTVLAIVYSLPSLPTGSIALLDGGQNTAGETTTVNLTSPLGDVSSPSFAASLGLGISFSFNSATSTQLSTVDVNGTRLTNVAGNFDDGGAFNGGLITVGGIGDDPSNNVGSVADDDELYDLKPFLSTGATSFTVLTRNASSDDNIFFASLYVTGQIGTVTPGPIDPIPEPETYALMLAGLGLLGAAAKRRKAKRAA